jgi:hypothetical protein
MSLQGGRTLIEAPMTTARLLGRRLPACGGGYLRHLPMAYTSWAFRQVARRRPVIVYLHPYEIELDVAEVDTSAFEPEHAHRVRRFHRMQTRGRATVEWKVCRLLRAHRFEGLWSVIGEYLGRTGLHKGP